MYEDSYFYEYQRDLLRFANTAGGRFLLGIKDKYPIVKLVPNGFHQIRDFNNKGKPIITAKFFLKDFCLDFAYSVIQVQAACGKIVHPMTMIGRPVQIENPYKAFLHYSGIENSRKNYPLILLSVFTGNPHATGSGQILRNGDANWATSRAAASGSSIGQDAFRVQNWAGIGADNGARRGFLVYNTSSIGAGSTIDGAGTNRIQLMPANLTDGDNDGNDFVVGMKSTQASNTNLVNDDFDQTGDAADNPTEFTNRIDIGNLTAESYSNFDLNANGRAWINVTGYTAFGWREGHDVVNDVPANATGNNVECYVNTSGKEAVFTVTYISLNSRFFPFFRP